MSNTYSEAEKVKVKVTSQLLWILGDSGFTELKIGDQELVIPSERYLHSGATKELILEQINSLDNENFQKLYQIIQFYLARHVSSWVVEQCEELFDFNDYAADNERLSALSSIIDWLANPCKQYGGHTKRFQQFIENELNKNDKKELVNLLATYHFVQKNGLFKKRRTIKKFAQYVYEIRSEVAHNALLTGMEKFNFPVAAVGSGGMAVDTSRRIMVPKDVRRYLWKAILNNLKLSLPV